MIILASNSPTRAKILQAFNINFQQISCDYDETLLGDYTYKNYSSKIVELKAKQFFDKFQNLDRVLFADSSVICKGEILGKAKDIKDARRMLNLQSDSKTSVYTAMKFISKDYTIDMLSVASFVFDEFDLVDLENYLKSGDWKGKAGAMTIENFNKKYILKEYGNKTTAMGLDIENLKAFL